jgi:hypothetical protein
MPRRLAALPVPALVPLAAVAWLAFRPGGEAGFAAEPAASRLRVATFNVSLYGERQGDLRKRLEGGADPQARRLAAILQQVRPQIVLLNEIDVDPDCLEVFERHYLGRPQALDGQGALGEPLQFAHRLQPASNTGVHAERDLNRDGAVELREGSPAYADDCWGYGRYPGQYGWAVLSQFPIDAARVRTFRTFLWKDMPGALLPDDPETNAPGDWYAADALERFPLSSKNHGDVPIRIGDRTVHLLASHPTPPAFDGSEQRNRRRNHDEIRLWTDYLSGPAASSYLTDDAGVRGGLDEEALFVIAGDLNADPHDGRSTAAIAELLAHPRVGRHAPPRSTGGAVKSARDGGVNARHAGDPACDTLDASERGSGPGNLRVDYVLPAAGLRVVEAGVFWPAPDDPQADLVWGDPFPSSDHRLAWIDLACEGSRLATDGDLVAP